MKNEGLNTPPSQRGRSSDSNGRHNVWKDAMANRCCGKQSACFPHATRQAVFATDLLRRRAKRNPLNAEKAVASIVRLPGSGTSTSTLVNLKEPVTTQ